LLITIFLISMIMLTPHLQKLIDDKWDGCWPVSTLRPLAILDLTSYVFFIKKLDDQELINKKLEVTATGDFVYTKGDHFIYSGIEEFTWSNLKDKDAQQIHDLFNKEFGLIEKMAEYGQKNFLYSYLFKAPLLLTPTPKLLFNVIGIINLIESSDKNTQEAIVDYLFIKADQTGQNGQQFIPEYISRLMISIAQPSAEEIIWDPSAGNGSLLINATAYIKSLATGVCEGWKGMESDLVQLRLAAMNMMLHGIKDTNLEFLEAKKVQLTDKPELIFLNLLFTEESRVTNKNGTSQVAYLEKEVFLLNLILENLPMGGRAVILVADAILKSDIPSILQIRKDIVDKFNLEGVINLPSKSNSLFSGAGILIFNKHELVTTKKVWFCKMQKIRQKSGEQVLNDSCQNDLSLSHESNEVNDILNKWENRGTTPINNPGNPFYIQSGDIKNNDYSLNSNDYKLITARGGLNTEAENSIPDTTTTIVATKKEYLNHFFDESIPLQEEKPKRKLLPALIVLLVLIISGTGFYFFNIQNENIATYHRNKRADSSTITNSDSYNKTQDESAKIDSATTIVSSAAEQTPAETIAAAPDTNKSITSTAAPIAQTPVAWDSNINSNSIFSKRLDEVMKMNGSASDSSDSDVSSQKDVGNLHKPGDILKYTVISKAWFYRTPDTASKEKEFFLEPREGQILNGTLEENGFVYVIYVNTKGQSTRGWLNKKDLQVVE